MNEEKTKIKMDDGVTRFFTRFVYLFSLSPFLTGQMFLFAEHTLDSSTNYDSFLNMVRTVQRTLLRSQLACNEMQASARNCGRQHDLKCRLKSSKVK